MSWIGCVDAIADTCISGWAADAAGSAQPVQVEIIINDEVIAAVSCDQFRQDLLAAGIGDGRKAFRFDPSGYLRPGRNALKVRYAGTNITIHQGHGYWVTRREGGLSDGEANVLAALEAYHEFTAADQVCGIGKGAADLEPVLRAAGVPFRKFIGLETPRHLAQTGWALNADVTVSWAPSEPFPELGALLRLQGLLAIGVEETSRAPGQIRQAFSNRRVQLESVRVTPIGARRLFAFVKTGEIHPVDESASPVVAHIHVPKCAGTSFRGLLERYYGPGYLNLYVDDTYFVYGEETLRSYLLQNPQIRGFSSHHVRSFPHWLAGREMLYVAFLRDPIQQFVSYITHIQKNYATITAKTLLEAVPPQAPQLSSREFARWLLTQTRDIPFRENHNVNFFARHSAPEAADQLDAAKGALEQFFFVGITERMEESMRKLRARAREADLDFPTGAVPIENPSADYRDDLSWIHPSDEVGCMLLQSLDKDRQLYDWAAARL